MMEAADIAAPADQKSIFDGLIRVTYQGFGQPAQLLLITFAQLAIAANQAHFNLRKLMPRRCSHFNVTTIGVLAIQHAYHSIKCIADAVIWGQADGQADTASSIRSFDSLVCHGLNKSPNGSLIIRRDASVLLNDAVFNLIQ